MKNIWIVITLSSTVLFSCGGSGDDNATETPNNDFVVNLANTTWKKECSPYNKSTSEGGNTLWNVNIKLSIDSSLKSTYRTEFFHPTDTSCDAMMFDTLEISTFEIKGKATSEESIEAYGLNETFIYNSENNVNSANYTLFYIHSERLYFGQKSGSNLGETPETRHTSISLDNYFTQVIN